MKFLPAVLLSCFAFNTCNADIYVTDDLGETLVFNQPVKKIITLSPHLTELVYDAGALDKLIATVEYSDYPEQAKNIPRLGSYNTWNLEKIIALEPDIVFIWLSANGMTPVEKLRQLGISVYVSEPDELSDISRTIKDIGKIAGSSQTAGESASRFDDGIQALADKYAQQDRVRLFYQVWSQPLMTINGRQLISQLFSICGGDNVFSDLPTLAPVVSIEALIVEDPEAIIGGARKEDQQLWLSQWKKWPSLKAVKRDNLFFINPDYLNRHTTRMLQGAESLCVMLDTARNKRMTHVD